MGYYDLATIIYPESGISHNQLAVIALTDGNHLRSTYHLYRALSVEEPHPSAKDNLEIEVRKAQQAQSNDDGIIADGIPEGQDLEEALAGCYMRLHARCYKGVDHSGHDGDEKRLIRHLVAALKERSLESIIHRILMINIAAQYFAGIRLKG